MLNDLQILTYHCIYAVIIDILKKLRKKLENHYDGAECETHDDYVVRAELYLFLALEIPHQPCCRLWHVLTFFLCHDKTNDGRLK